MRAYITTKLLTKLIIGTSCLAVVLTAGSVFLSNSKLSANPPVDCNSFPTPTIDIPGGTTVKPGESFNIKITNPSTTNNYLADIYLSNGQGSYVQKYTHTEIEKSSPKDFSVSTSGSAEGMHHLKIKLYVSNNGCFVGLAEPQVCISPTGTCSGTEPNITLSTSPRIIAVTAGNGGMQIAPPSSWSTVDELINHLFGALSGIIAVLGFIGFIVGGYMVLTAGPNAPQAEKGKKTILYSIMGMFLASLSYVIIHAAGDLLK